MGIEQTPTVVGLGELLWDCFGEARRPGGAPANVAFHAAQLGCRGVVCSRVGQDELGDALCRHLAAQGLETTWIQRDSNLPTGTVTVAVDRPGHHEFTIHENVAWDALEFDGPTRELMQQTDAVCFGTLAQRGAKSRETIHRCLAAARPGCLAVYDVNFRQHWYERASVEWSLDRADVVKLNAEEVAPIAKLLGFRAIDHAHFLRRLLERYDLRAVCLTRGERGCLLASRDDIVDLPGVPVEVADSVGAGDAFTAAFIFGLLNNWPLEATARLANEVGGLVASKPGAMPPLRDEFCQLIERLNTSLNIRH